LINADFSFATAVGLFNSVINFAIIIIVNAISRKISETSLW
jgi:putative aldouronate transport system permease protein